jgi:general stress protein 26
MSQPRSNDAIRSDLAEYLTNHHLLTMATATKDGDPDATALEYANEGFTVYVTCRLQSRKVQNVTQNPRVFYEIHDDTPIDYTHIKQVKAIQATARVEVLRPQDPEFNAAFSILQKKFPVFERMAKDTRVILVFHPKIMWLLNYARKFFLREQVVFETD